MPQHPFPPYPGPRRQDPSDPRRRVLRVRLAVLALVVLVVLVLPAIVRFSASWLWMSEIGFQRVLSREIVTRVVLFTGTTLLSWGVLLLGLRIARGRHRPLPVPMDDIGIVGAGRRVRPVGRLPQLVALGLAVMVGLAVAGGWMAVLQALHGVPFGVADPVFGRDAGYYVYTLPVVSGALSVLGMLIVLSGILAAVFYVMSGDISVSAGFVMTADGPVAPPQQLKVSRAVTGHLVGLVVAWLVVAALRTWLVDLPGLLFSTTGPMVGASYTDVHARLPGMHVSAVAALLAAAALAYWLVRGGSTRFALLSVGAYVAVSLLGRALYPALVQKLVVSPTELTREAPYLARHIAATRRAWGLDAVTTGELRGESTLTLQALRENAATIENVRLWDRDPLLQTFGQLQEIRTYYDFLKVDDDRYWIDGRYRQVLLSPRELNSASLPTRSFINEHLTFTHGMGLTLAPVNQVTDEGLPVLLVKDLPPVTTGDLRITRPQIYFGELTNSYAVVKTKQREFDFPSGEDNIFRSYEGNGGVALSSAWRRLVLAWHFGELKLLLSGDIGAGSRILYNRSVADRARRALPFLRFDRDPYLVITGKGELVWLLDAYTVSDRYPYSSRLADGTSYMRNSVKVVIDAYHGSVHAYVSDPRDPIVRTYDRIFPGILRPLATMPADVRAHMRYPEDLFRAQVALYTIYHMTDAESFYHREDQWQIPALEEEGEQNTFMRHIVMRLPGEDQAEFIFMSPFTPRGKDNLAAWMVARNDGEHYGQLREYRFPKQSLVFGPQQIVNRMNQDTEIARQISLWDQRGSQVIRGALMVIPIDESIIYVQPLYLRAEGGKIPELKRVIVAYQNRVVMEETLEAGLGRLFGGGAVAPGATPARADSAGAAGTAGPSGASAATARPATPPRGTTADPATAQLLARARQHYDRAIAAQRAGDWATYGAEIERLGQLLRQVEAGARP